MSELLEERENGTYYLGDLSAERMLNMVVNALEARL